MSYQNRKTTWRLGDQQSKNTNNFYIYSVYIIIFIHFGPLCFQKFLLFFKLVQNTIMYRTLLLYQLLFFKGRLLHDSTCSILQNDLLKLDSFYFISENLTRKILFQCFINLTWLFTPRVLQFMSLRHNMVI